MRTPIQFVAALSKKLRETYSPRRFPYGRFVLSLIVGGAGGWLFSYLGMPLPWMLGAMTTCMIAALLGAKITAPKVVRAPMISVIGVLLGSSFSPHLFDGISAWVPSLLWLMLFVFCCGALNLIYFRVVVGFDKITAYFSAMPGGLVEMVTLGERYGGNGTAIALVHSARVSLIVFSLPFVVQFVGDVDLGARASPGQPLLDSPLASHLWLLGTALAGAILGHYLRLPASFMLGPLILSALVHMLGWSNFKISTEIVNFAQLVLGTYLGSRFVASDRRYVMRILLLSLGSSAILLLLTLSFALLVSRTTATEFVPLLLAFSPGGLAEMSLMALALQIEVAFVTLNHLMRILIVLVAAPLAFRLLKD